MAENKTWFTKTIARDTLSAKTAELLTNGDITSDIKDMLDTLFAGRTVAANTIVKNEDGEVVMKRCSYFEGYLPISEFGTVGKDEKTGDVKYAYQSKAGATAARKAKSELETAIKEADEQLEVDEDVSAWKATKSDAVTASEIKADYEGDETLIATYEDACESIA